MQIKKMITLGISLICLAGTQTRAEENSDKLQNMILNYTLQEKTTGYFSNCDYANEIINAAKKLGISKKQLLELSAYNVKAMHERMYGCVNCGTGEESAYCGRPRSYNGKEFIPTLAEERKCQQLPECQYGFHGFNDNCCYQIALAHRATKIDDLLNECDCRK